MVMGSKISTAGVSHLVGDRCGIRFSHSLGIRPLSLRANSFQKWSGDGEVSLKMQSLEQTALISLNFALF